MTGIAKTERVRTTLAMATSLTWALNWIGFCDSLENLIVKRSVYLKTNWDAYFKEITPKLGHWRLDNN